MKNGVINCTPFMRYLEEKHGGEISILAAKLRNSLNHLMLLNNLLTPGNTEKQYDLTEVREMHAHQVNFFSELIKTLDHVLLYTENHGRQNPSHIVDVCKKQYSFSPLFEVVERNFESPSAVSEAIDEAIKLIAVNPPSVVEYDQQETRKVNENLYLLREAFKCCNVIADSNGKV